MSLTISEEVKGALDGGRPVVALESTIVSHGMPWPQNFETALAVEAVVREAGAVPATIAVLDGAVRVGLDRASLERLAKAEDVLKLSRADLAYAVATGRPGATTVAATMIVAARAGIKVFATGGIGGVHRGAEASFDVSADIAEFTRSNVVVVAAGAKALLDLPKTLEVLETLGVPVVCYRTDTFPAFWSRDCRPPRAAPPRHAGGDRRLRPGARGADPSRGGARRQPGAGGARDPGSRDGGPHRRGAPRLCGGGGDRQGGDAIPARRDLATDRRPQPHDQHRAHQEQRAPGSGDRGGAGWGVRSDVQVAASGVSNGQLPGSKRPRRSIAWSFRKAPRADGR